jgi:hypothetical protein
MKRPSVGQYAAVVAVLCGGLGVAGCGGYYSVKDPGTGKVYYTEKIDRSQSGAVKLTDARSGSTVTLQSSEVTELSQDGYKQALAASAPPPATVPAPAAPATPK